MFNILVVEDDFNTRRLMCAVLERYGYNPIPSTDGMDALEQLDKKHVDLIILDIMMPRMDGYEFTRVLREGGNTLPILMVTAKETPADKHKGFIIGTDDYMTKPVDEEEMILRIAALLRRSRIVSERKLTVGSTVLYYDAFTVRDDGEAVGAPGGMELPQRNSSCSISFCPTPTRSSPAVSSWTRSGTWSPRATSAPWTCTSAACGNASATTEILRSSRFAASAIKRYT